MAQARREAAGCSGGHPAKNVVLRPAPALAYPPNAESKPGPYGVELAELRPVAVDDHWHPIPQPGYPARCLYCLVLLPTCLGCVVPGGAAPSVHVDIDPHGSTKPRQRQLSK